MQVPDGYDMSEPLDGYQDDGRCLGDPDPLTPWGIVWRVLLWSAIIIALMAGLSMCVQGAT